jgi:ketoreductase RED2
MTTLNKKVAIVTGSTSGIGEAIARMISREGAQVVINSVSSQDKGKALAHELQGLYCQADIAIEADCQRLINATVQHYGRLDFLINNAGAVGRLPSSDLADISNELFSQMLNINVVGTWCLIRYAIPHLKHSQDGVIINITSVAGTDAAAATSSVPYAVCKAGLNHLTKLLAKELGPEIRVNAIAPGLIKTPRAQDFKAAIDKFTEHTPLKRIGDPDDIAEIALALIKSNYINGEIVVVDGGFSTC